MTISFADKIEQLTTQIPKVELHLHLEGAIPVEILFHLIQRQEREPSIKNLDDLRRKLTYSDFAHFIKEEKDFEEIAYGVLHNLSKQNVKYVEAFYSPGDYWRQGLSVQGITECLIKGKERAYRDFGIQSELIMDLIRDHGPPIPMLLSTKKRESEASGLLLTQVRWQGLTPYGQLLRNWVLSGSVME